MKLDLKKLCIFGCLIGACCDASECSLQEPQAYCSPETIASATIDHGFIAQGSYLYWQAKEDGLEYIQQIGISTDLLSGTILADSSPFEPDSKWTNGFRVALGYIFSARSQWDVTLNWTSFHSEANNPHSAPRSAG